MDKKEYKELLKKHTVPLDMDSVDSILQYMPPNIDFSEYESSIEKWSGEYKVISVYKGNDLSRHDWIVYTPSGAISTREYSMQRLGLEKTNRIFPTVDSTLSTIT